MNMMLKNVLPLLILGSVPLVIFLVKGIMSLRSVANTDIDAYQEVLEHQCKVPELVRHFPKEIPERASNVKFSYSGDFLLKDARLQLRLDLPEVEFEKELAKFSGKEKMKYTGGDKNDHANMEGGAPTTFFYTNDTSKFPDEYTILLLYIDPSFEEVKHLQADGKYEWEHGENYGIAYSKKTHTIVYWVESW